MSTRLSPEQYLACIEADTARMAEVAAKGLDAPVPPCPGWTVGEAVRHTASVYWHKIMGMRLGRRPEDGEWPTDPAEGQSLVDWLRSSHAELHKELSTRGPDEPSPTWLPSEQNVGFWFRRMAHEVAIHRVDAESGHDDVTPIDEALATDGIDEVLRIFATDPDPETLSGRKVVAVEAGGHRWVVTLGPAEVSVTEEGPADATVRGSASDVDLWLWNRPAVGTVKAEGAPDALGALRARLAAVTS